MTALITATSSTALSTEVDRLTSTAESLIKGARAASTVRVYGSQWRAFTAWAGRMGLSALPAAAGTVALYVAHLVDTGRGRSTIAQALAAIGREHALHGLESPTTDRGVHETVQGARRRITARPRKKAAATPDRLRAMVEALDLSTLQGLRDRAILCMGFAGAFRRSELAALTVDDLQETQDATGRRAYIVTVQHSKTDQESRGMVKALFTASHDRALCPVTALDEWMTAAHITAGPIFRSVHRGGHVQATALDGGTVARIVQGAARRAGIMLDMGGHSLRRGFVTAAIDAGAQERAIAHQTGHRSIAVLREYQERHDVMTDNAAAGLI